MQSERWRFSIDVGGTFTDVIATDPGGRETVAKILSSGRLRTRVRPQDDARLHRCPDDLFVGWSIRRLAGLSSPRVSSSEATSPEAGEPDASVASSSATRWTTAAGNVLDEPVELWTGEPSPIVAIRLLTQTPLGQPLPPVDLRLRTTRGTNALLERRGAAVGLLATAGFGDILRIGDQSRPDLFAIDIERPSPLTQATAEVRERIAADGAVIVPLSEADVRGRLAELREAGCEAVAIALVNALANPSHEQVAAKLAREAGFAFVATSAEASAEERFLSRTRTAVLDAYLAPVLREYVAKIRDALPSSSLRLMTSLGQLVPPERFEGAESVLSGPAGGVVSLAAIGRTQEATGNVGDAGNARPDGGVIGLDIGGTSTDVSRWGRDDGVEVEAESTKAGVAIAKPMLAIETIAAGGGSVCRFDGAKFVVGPESAGADPGPACYGRGGPLTLTDCNVALDRIDVSHFPFPLDTTAVRRRLAELCEQLAAAGKTAGSDADLANAFVRVADLAMAAAIRRTTIAKGRDPARHMLVAFGGAGPQHACGVADELDITRVLVHRHAGLQSAFGLSLADRSLTREAAILRDVDTLSWSEIDAVRNNASDALAAEAERVDDVAVTVRMREFGTEATLDVPIEARLPAASRTDRALRETLSTAYRSAYRERFGFERHRRNAGPLEVVGLRATATMRTEPTQALADDFPPALSDVIDGPSLLADGERTVFVAAGWQAEAKAEHIVLTRHTGATSSAIAHGRRNELAKVSRDSEPLRLAVASHRLAAIAEQAGETLRRTAVSPNIRERLDFSVAVFDAGGRLVVNAPHVPVHLGAMGQTVRELVARSPMPPGAAYLTNDPARGGSHLPDLTLVTPVHRSASDPRGATGPTQPVAFVASRAHHAEIGGTVPGSVPAASTTLAEEGVLLSDFPLARDGVVDWDGLESQLRSGPHPSRAPQDNLADVAAQLACHRQAVAALQTLFRQDDPTESMRRLRETSGQMTREVIAAWTGGVATSRTVRDVMDDGSAIICRVDATPDGTMRLDFTGSADVCRTNLNANRAIVTSAALYAVRLLIGRHHPSAASLLLNEGVLDPVAITLPPGMLNAFEQPRTPAPAVVGGNTETSQRVVDVLVAALGLAAASQGTMNNLTFGTAASGYYETIGGGSGASDAGGGTSGVQVHMTNTRITDCEVLERRRPVRVWQFALRRGSGGDGRHRGGDGLVREIEFLEPMRLSLLTGRRETAPPGHAGGQPGTPGQNWLLPAMGEPVGLKWRDSRDVAAGDRVRIETPGGGGFGTEAMDRSS